MCPEPEGTGYCMKHSEGTERLQRGTAAADPGRERKAGKEDTETERERMKKKTGKKDLCGQEPMEFTEAVRFLAESNGRLTRGDYLVIDGIRIAYFLATHAHPWEMELILSDAEEKWEYEFYMDLKDIYARCGRGLPKEISAAAGLPKIWENMMRMIAEMLDTICPKELRETIRRNEGRPDEPGEEPDPDEEEDRIRRLMTEIPGFDRSRFNPEEEGYDCRGCAYYLPEDRRCRFTECMIEKKKRERAESAGRKEGPQKGKRP